MSWWTPASLEQTCALASCQSQLLVASAGGVNTRLARLQPSVMGGRLSSMAMGLSVPAPVRKKSVRVP